MVTAVPSPPRPSHFQGTQGSGAKDPKSSRPGVQGTRAPGAKTR